MKKILALFIFALTFPSITMAFPAITTPSAATTNLTVAVTSAGIANPIILMDTSKGMISIELYPEKAPQSVANFLRYIEKDHFKKTIFHRVIKNFMIQGGGFTESGSRAETFPPITNESTNGLSNERGTISMARTNYPHTATRQFFINQRDNTFLDAQTNKWGYAVFGKVISGMDVIDDIAAVATTGANNPVKMISINSISLKKAQ